MDFFIYVRIVFGILFLGTLIAGWFLFKNQDRLFGPHPDAPGDNIGARGLNKVQVIAIWLHAVVLTATFAFFIH